MKNESNAFYNKDNTMKFCTDCNNMLYSVEERDKKAYLKCLVCPYEEEITKKNPIVYEHDLRQDTSVQYSVNPYIKFDPTLPTFTNMVCPNDGCPTRGKQSNVKGIKLDSTNVIWMYQCVECDKTWKQMARGSA